MLNQAWLSQPCPNCQTKNLTTSRFCVECGHELGRRCGRCGAINLSRARYCAACGAELPHTCPQCHALNPPHARFCGTCAHPLEEGIAAGRLPKGGRERRKVSVLFAGVSNFFSLLDHMSTEECYLLLDQVLRRLTAEVDRFSGTVSHFTSNGIMAVFGAPTPLEQHALHAVWAALAMRETIWAFNEEANSAYGVQLQLQVGIDAGEVIAGEVGTDHLRAYTVVGKAVHLAEQLEQIAQPGTIVVSEAVYRTTWAFVEYNRLSPLQLDENSSPIPVYEALSTRPQPGRSRGILIPGQHVVPLVGRRQELEALQALVEAFTRYRRRVALIVGEAGIGKSRLLEEFIGSITLPHRVLTISCYEHTQYIPYAPFADLLRRYFDLPFGHDPVATRRQIEVRMHELLPDRAQELLPFVLHLLAADEAYLTFLENLTPIQVKKRVFEAVKTLLAAEAVKLPLVLLIEDLHWIDNLSAELLEYLIATLEDVPVLICCSSRSVRDKNRDWEKILNAAAPNAYCIVSLGPLSQEETEHLLDLLLPNQALPSRLRREIVQYSEGVPLYLEELLQTLIETGILAEKDGRWEATTQRSLQETGIPRTVEEIILTRYARLDPHLRDVLNTAAVIGRHVPFQLLEASVEATDPALLPSKIEALVEAGFLTRRASVSTEYAFVHRLAREVIYQNLLESERRQIHFRVARAIEEVASPDSDDYVELAAYHYAASTHVGRAIPYFIRAGQKATTRYAHREALEFFQQARSIAQTVTADVDGSLLIAIEAGMGDVLSFMGRYEEARAAYERALHLSQEHENPTLQASLWRRIGNTFERQGQYEEALEALRTAHNLLQAVSSPDPVELARVCSDMGWILFRRGQLHDARTWLLQALELSRQSKQEAITANVLNRLGGVAFQQGDMRIAIQYTQGSLTIREKLGQRDEVARTSMNLAIIYSVLGEWKRALKFYEQAANVQRELGEHEGLTMALINSGLLYTLLGEFKKAHAALEEAQQLARRLNSAFLETQAAQALAQLLIAEEEWHQADAVLTEALSKHGKSLPPPQKLLVLALLGEATVKEGNTERAAAIAEEVKTLAQASQEHLDPQTNAFLYRFYGLLAEAQGDLEEAYTHLVRSYEVETEAYGKIRTLIELARVEVRLGHPDLAVVHFSEALDLAKELGAKGEERRIQRLKRELNFLVR